MLAALFLLFALERGAGFVPLIAVHTFLHGIVSRSEVLLSKSFVFLVRGYFKPYSKANQVAARVSATLTISVVATEVSTNLLQLMRCSYRPMLQYNLLNTFRHCHPNEKVFDCPGNDR